MKKIFSCFMILFLLVFSPSPARATSDSFIDVHSHWAEKDMAAVINLGLMSGMGDNGQGYKVFAPANQVSRAQLASILQQTFELDYGKLIFVKQPQASDYYRDVNNQAWYADAVMLCALNHVFDSADYFNPNQAVTRMEAARGIFRCVDARDLTIPMIMLMPCYQDTAGLSQEDTNALVFCSNTGLMRGDGRNWRPNDEITRAELARVMNGLIKLMAVNENANGQEYRLTPGNSFTLMLDSNPTTGYCWTASYNEETLTLVGENYQGSDVSGNTAGQGGKDLWRFKALKAGSTEIKMIYSRPWDSVQPQKTFTLKVIIAPEDAGQEKLVVRCQVVKEKSDIIDIDLNIPVLSGPLDTKVQSAINKRFEQEAIQLKKNLETEALDYAQECEAADYPIRPYQLVTRCQQYLANNHVLSLYVDYYQYTGGAHGMTDRRAYNIDLKTGELLPLKELFQPGCDYKTVIDQEISRQIALEPDHYFAGNMGFQGISEEPYYYLDGKDLVIYFTQYEIAPYAAGIPEFKIPLKLFNNEYRPEIID